MEFLEDKEENSFFVALNDGDGDEAVREKELTVAFAAVGWELEFIN